MPSAALAGLLLALGQLPWEIALRSEARGFTDSASSAGDLQLDPRVTLGYETRDVVVHAGYSPQLLLREPRARGTFDHVQAGSLSGSLRLDRDTRLRADQTLSAGSTSLSWLALSPDAPPPFITRGAREPSVDMLNESSSLSLDQMVTRRIHINGTASYAIAGGFGNGVQTVPRTRTADLRASGSWIERRDAFSLAAGGSRGWTSTSSTTWLLDASGAWQHAFTPASENALRGEGLPRLGELPQPRYETELSAGAAVLGGSEGVQHGVVPTVALALRRDEPTLRAGAFGARVLLRYAPVLDVATGLLTPRYEASSMADLRLGRQVVAFAGGGVAMTPNPDPPLPTTLAQGALGLTYEPVAGVSISAAARVARLPDVEWAGVVTTTVVQRGRF